MISFIIPTWNTRAITQKCLDSIFKHLPPSKRQIIIIDNHSTDDSQSHFSTQKGIVYRYLDQNYGYSYACNQGAKVASGDYFFFLNSDTELQDDSCLSLIEKLDTDRQIGLIAPQLLNSDGTIQNSIFPPQTPANAFRQFFLHIPNSYLPYSINLYSTNIAAVLGAAMLMSKSTFRRIRGWDEDFHFYYEDLDLCRRLTTFGLKIAYDPGCRIYHHHGQSGKNIQTPANQWRRLIPSAKRYFGPVNYFLIQAIIKASRLFS